MFLKSLKLRNIRSYVEESLEFPEGIVLLAGDIGAGKSTILLAIEFALFGILRGELSGSALLRNGEKEGSVELSFEINGKDYTIGRKLKRNRDSIEQDAGFIIADGKRREMTALELKTAVLGLIGYPSELVTKSKSLIYRYTVYTPQEEMKRIILSDKEDRLMILRKVFDIDKYKRIIDNAREYSKALRAKKENYEGQLADEPVKRKQLQEKQEQASDVRISLLDIQPRLESAKQAVLQQKMIIEGIDRELKALQQHRIAYQSADAEQKTLASSQKQLQAEIAMLSPLVAQAPEQPKQAPEEIERLIQQKQHELQLADREMRAHIMAHAELKAKKQLSELTIKRILDLNRCPTCLQEVNEQHKHSFAEKEKQNTDAIIAQMSSFEASASQKEQAKARLQQEINALTQSQAAARDAQYKFQQYEANKLRKEQAEKRLKETIAAISAAETKKQQASAFLQSANAVEMRFQSEKSRLEQLQQQERAVSEQNVKLLERQQMLFEAIELLEKDLEAKQKARQQLEKLSVLHQWIDEFFTGLMAVMERHVMTKVYHEFNALFQQWFSLLIEDEVLAARLDEEFSPVVQQNGYDTEVGNLSGGEKTACALAYRLALNKVITSLRSTIHTKDVVILDEPTDGFSAEQIDRMRDVLGQLNARQIILVSHEAKIESLAGRVLRVVKEGHASKVVV
ncbi:MAG: AAA family ATPase [Candidatus Woesearchaeota archaeon]